MASKVDKPNNTRRIDVLIFNDVNLLDVSGPAQAFEAANAGPQKRYITRYVSLDGQSVRASCGLTLVPDAPLTARSKSDDLLIPGGNIAPLQKSELLMEIIQQRAKQAGDGRLISICSGALVLAAAGVLDGRIATTHWAREHEAKAYDKILWDLDRICATDGRIHTSAGVSTGIDLALAIIRDDCGVNTALAVARELVVQLRRTGGQSQYAMHLAAQFTMGDRLSSLIEQIVSSPQMDCSLEALAERAGMNTRTLTRHFKRELDLTPAQFVERIRVDHARGLLLDKVPLKQVALESGFGDLQRMRRAFQRRFGVHVSDYQNAFG